MKSMVKWVEDLNQFLEDGLDCDNESISNYLENLSGLLSDKDLIDEDLTLLKNDVKSGKCGSEYIKPLLNDIQNLEKQLKDSVSKAANVKNSLNQNRDQMKACDKSLNQVEDWIKNFDDSLEKVNKTGNPEKCDELMNKFKAHLSTEPTVQNALKEAREMYSKLKSSAPKNLKDSILLKKMQDLESKFKDRSETGKAIDKSLKDFDKSLSKAKDWQNDYQKKINNFGPLSNDITKLKQQLEKLENLKRSQGDGEKVIQEAIEKGQTALTFTNNLEPIQKKINSDLESVENKWLENTENLDHLKDEIMGQLTKVEGVMQTGNKVENWLKDKETDLKSSKGLCDTLSQKLAKIDDLKKLLNDIECEAPILEDYFGQLEEIGESDPNSLKKLHLTKQHLNNIKQNIKNAIDEAEGRVSSHQGFINKLDEAGEWLELAKALKLDAVMTETPGNTQELKRRKEIIEKLIESKNNGEALVKAAFTSGEAVARETSLKGKEDILNGVRGLNKDFLDLLDGLGAAKQTIEMKLTKASNLNRDLDAIEKWSREFEKKIDHITDSDLDKIKVLCDEAQAKLYLVDNLYNQTKSMDDPEFQARAERIKAQIKENLGKSQQMYSNIRDNVSMYNDLIKSCKNINNWINESEKKLMRYGESTASNPEELNNNLKLLEKLSEDVKGKKYDIEKVHDQGQDLSISSPSKSSEINSLLKNIDEKYQDLTDSLEKKEQGLRDNIEDQRDFEEAIYKAQHWLNETTQKLLKHSDIKQCTPSLVDAFCRSFEDIVESIPYGEEAINTAMYIGKNHLTHLNGMKLQGLNNLERDTKRINELDKNWNDFKKQIDLVDKNVHRVKDNLDDFHLLQKKLEGYLKDKENCLNESLPIDSLRYIINEVDDAAKDLDRLQAKAIEVNGSLNYPNATTIAKGIVDKFQNLKRSIETELNKAKQLDNDWAAYKNAVNACEKWIVDTGFRIIENDYSAFSPEDAQTKLDDHSRICDQINNFAQDVERVVKMGKQLAYKVSDNPKSKANSIPFTHHSESEIKADIDNLQGSHKSLLGNANETKNRLNEQLVNWRKYRDLVQTNDQFLSNELADWWKDKKHFPPQTNEEADKNIKEAKEILKNLLSRQAEMKISKSNCQSLSLENGPRDFSALAEVNRKRRMSLTTPLSRLAESVETGLEKNIEEIQKYIPQLENLCQDWNNFQKDLEELEFWTKEKEKAFEKKIAQPCMKKSSLTEDQRQFGNQLKKEIENHEKKINNLLEKAQSIGSRKVNPLLKRIEDLKRKLKQFLERKDEGIDAVDFDYIDKQTVACQNSGIQNNVSENIATQTLPEKYNISTSTEPRMRKTKTQTIKRDPYIPVNKSNYFGLRNSGGNRGISKMLYPYCCTSDLLNQKLNLDYVHEFPSKVEKTTSTIPSSRKENDYQPTRLGISKVRNGTEESVRRNWIPQDLL